ncbi:hypothetical protein AMTR_s00113p00002460 [Amborella trichopoda]|uniref:Uncharacterized protein n=1 Tax=Amborella trichopoda TaxID=13333 RepID=W1NV15_AMBTC|nr:hypothetical protein AMTR_s00113p00002460 [Amborella trichopoda]
MNSDLGAEVQVWVQRFKSGYRCSDLGTEVQVQRSEVQGKLQRSEVISRDRLQRFRVEAQWFSSKGSEVEAQRFPVKAAEA